MQREIKTYNNKLEVLNSIHGHLYTPFERGVSVWIPPAYKTDCPKSFIVWNDSWCELAVHVLSDPTWGLRNNEITGVRFG